MTIWLGMILMEVNMNKVVERFLGYVKVNTISDPESEVCPSTAHQIDFGKMLVEEMLAMGIVDAQIDKNGYVTGTVPSNVEEKVPTIGFIAHMDTAPDYSGEHVNPQIVGKYDCTDVVLNKEKNIIMKVKDFPELLMYEGKTLITTDGTTLLGADNKAGIAEILTAAERLLNDQNLKHGDIKIGFTPDEEIGRGADLFDVEGFGADFAYTIDGGEIGEVEYENFNAASADIKITGINIHPGNAKDKMINSIIVATEFNEMMPSVQRPEHTEDREGFIHLHTFDGSVENTRLKYIVRDHNMEKFNEKKALITAAAAYLNVKYGQGTVEVVLTESYLNMKEKIEPVMHIIDAAVQAMEALGIEPKMVAIRGGTDGARLSYMGLPTPNLFTGGHNFHGKFEYIVTESMDSAVDVILKIIDIYSK